MREAAPRRDVRRVLACVLLVAACAREQPSDARGDRSATELLAAAAEREQAGELAAALAHAKAAAEAGGGRDASLTIAKLAIELERYEDAVAVLEPLLAEDPGDAVALYDLALVHHRRGDYNRARTGYLAALRADVGQADARYNLAVLCWEQGVRDEARHHAGKFRQAFPGDPRGAELDAMMAGG